MKRTICIFLVLLLFRSGREVYEYIGGFFTGAFIHINSDGIIDNVNFYGKTEVWN